MKNSKVYIYLVILILVLCQKSFSQDRNSPLNIAAIAAAPRLINIDVKRTAIIVVDMQNDFGAKGGMFDLEGKNISSIQNVIAPISKVLSVARANGIKIVYLKVAIMPDLSDLGEENSPYRNDLMHGGVGKVVKAPDGSDSRIQIRDTWNTDIIDELKPKKEDYVIYKSRFSGFYKTELDSILKKLNMKYLVFTGCTTSICVESTVRDATFRDYSPIVLSDCTAEPIGEKFARTNKDASLLIIQTVLGWVSTADNFIQGIKNFKVNQSANN